MTGTPAYAEVDPFDLPDWLGEAAVTWEPSASVHAGHRIPGRLSSNGHDPVACDLLAVDDAFPEPVAPDHLRVRAHQVWRHGEVLLLGDRDRVVLAVPGHRLDAETALEAVGRLARAVGAHPESYAVLLRAGSDQQR